MTAMTPLIKRHPLAAFFTLACSLTWFGGWASDAMYNGTLLSIALALPLALLIPGPLIAALIVTALTSGNPGLRALLRSLTQWRVGLHWYLIALLLPSALSLVAVYLNVLLGAPAPTAAQFGSWSSLLFMFGLRLVNPFDGPVMEELGWRGYALPRLQARYSPVTANLILGVLVAIWHLRWIMNGDLPVLYLPAIIAATILFGWIVNSTQGSVLLALLFHAADGLIIQGNFGLSGADATRLLWLQVAVWCLMAILVVLARGRNLGRSVIHPHGDSQARAATTSAAPPVFTVECTTGANRGLWLVGSLLSQPACFAFVYVSGSVPPINQNVFGGCDPVSNEPKSLLADGAGIAGTAGISFSHACMVVYQHPVRPPGRSHYGYYGRGHVSRLSGRLWHCQAKSEDLAK